MNGESTSEPRPKRADMAMPVPGSATQGEHRSVAKSAALYLARLSTYTRVRDGVGLALLAALVVLGLLLPNLGASSYILTIVYFGAFYAAVGHSWNLIAGFTGYLSIAHGAFVGIGAYSTILGINSGVPWVMSLVLGMVAAGFVAVVLGIPAIRLNKLAFAFATLFFTEIVRRLVLLNADITGGASGLYAVRLFSLDMTFRLMVVTSVLLAVGLLALRRSMLGREMFAIREDELAAETLGIRSKRIVLGTFAASAMAAALFGGIHGLFLGSILPESFLVLRFSLVTLAIPLIGGIGTVSGPLAAGFFYAWMRQSFQTTAPELHLVFLGVAITLIAAAAPNGLVPLLSRRMQPILLALMSRLRPTGREPGGDS